MIFYITFTTVQSSYPARHPLYLNIRVEMTPLAGLMAFIRSPSNSRLLYLFRLLVCRVELLHDCSSTVGPGFAQNHGVNHSNLVNIYDQQKLTTENLNTSNLTNARSPFHQLCCRM